MYRRLGVLVAIAIATAGCHVIDPSQNQMLTYTGDIAAATVNAGFEKDFNVSKTGEVSVTVTSISPSVTLGTFFGVSVGQIVSGQCQQNLQNNQFATVGTAAVDTQITSGSWCVIIYDPRGIFTVKETFTVKLSYPG